MPQKITLKAARVNAKLTLKEASKALGIDESILVRWEKQPGLVQSKYYPKIQEVYGFPVDSIIFFET